VQLRQSGVMSDLPPLPAQADVVIIGGGIIGASTALFLAQTGISVVLCEKGRIGGEQSSRNWGWTRIMGRDLAEIPLGLESLRLWSEMNQITGAETGWRRCGILNMCMTEAELAKQEAWLASAQGFQISSRVVRGSDLAEMLPGLAAKPIAGLHTPGDGRAEPAQATEAIARAAEAAGAVILTGCAVRGLDRAGGKITGVVTERGRIAAPQVVLAGGAWSRLFAGNAGINLPSLTILGSVLRTKPLAGLPELTVGGARIAFRKRLDGGYTMSMRNASISDITPDSFRQLGTFLPSLISGWRKVHLRLGRAFMDEAMQKRRWGMDEATPFEAVRVLDPRPSKAVLAGAKRVATEAFPGFAAMEVVQSWGGLMDVTPDAVPVISDVAQMPGLYLATGFSGHGFGIGPGAGRLMADIVLGRPPVVDPAVFRFGRFGHA
jgi:glycine/D-amino acid oxidase-like deaminating enzyme